MVEPVSVGAIVAALVAKALDRAEDGVIDDAIKVARKAVATLRRRFSGDAVAETVLESLVGTPDSERRAKELAELLDARAQNSPELLNELRVIIGEAKGAGVYIGSSEQVAEGDGNVQVLSLDSQVNVQPGSLRQPRP